MPNQEFPVNAERLDPYKTYRFRVKWDSKYVAGISKVSGLTRKTEAVPHREGGSPAYQHVSPGWTTWSPITLERGVTHDPEFENWANLVWSRPNSTKSTATDAGGKEVALKDFRKDIIIELYNEADQKVLSYTIFRCWVSSYTALPDLDANSGTTVAIQTLELQHEGWVRDDGTKEQAEPGKS
jgi:phage tail-like protein